MGTFNTIKVTLPEVKKSRGSYISISATLHYQGFVPFSMPCLIPQRSALN